MSDPTPANSSSAEDPTRERLLQAAGAVFAREGFAGGGVREICAAAGANVSAVRYHFGGKEALYRAVMVRGLLEVRHAAPMPELSDDEDPAETFRRWVEWFLRLLLVVETNHPFAGALIEQETARPTAALDDFVKNGARPIRDALRVIVAAVCDRPAGDRAVLDATHAVLGLVVSQKHAAPVFDRLGARTPTTVAAVRKRAAVLAGFALAGLGGIKA